MSEPYVPDASSVKSTYQGARYEHSIANCISMEAAGREFDAWLSEHDRQVAERAWRDGYYTGKRDYAGSITGGLSISTPNPHAKGEQE